MKRQQLARREGRANLGNGKVVIELSRKRDNSICVMLGGSAVSATGVYLAVRRVRNDVTMLFRALTSSRGIARRNPTLNPARPS